MKVESQVLINKSKTETWHIITNIKDAADIIQGIEKIEILQQPNSGLVGLKWSETRMYFGKPASIDKWITDAKENEFYKTKSEMDGFIFETTMKISETANGVMLASIHETIPQGLMSKLKMIPMIFFKGVIKKSINQDLADIKSAAEKK